jgi:urease accessory protein
VHTDLTVRYAGSILYRHHLTVGPRGPGWSGAAVLGGGRAVGSLVLAGPELPDAALPGGDSALMPLAGPGMLASAVGLDIRQVRAALDPLCAEPRRLDPADLGSQLPSGGPLATRNSTGAPPAQAATAMGTP